MFILQILNAMGSGMCEFSMSIREHISTLELGKIYVKAAKMDFLYYEWNSDNILQRVTIMSKCAYSNI